jgi:Protein-L-isoaspartate(D-aspartate) O-methyltransferase (PCMT)
MAQQDKITTIDLIRAILTRNRAALALGVSLAAVVLGASLVLLVADHSSVTAVQTDLAAERASMVTTIEAHAKEASTTLGRDYIAPEVLRAVSAVPRHEFVPDGLRGDAYADRPLPIGYGQTMPSLRWAPARVTKRRSSPILRGGFTRSRSCLGWRTALPRGCSGWAIPTSWRARAMAITAGRRRHPLTASSSLPRRAKYRRR